MTRHALPTIPHEPTSLSVDGLSKLFGGVHAVTDVSFELPAGDALALIGPNGAGKTTVFNLITHVYAPDAGNISVASQSINGLSPGAIARRGVIRTFQSARIFPGMTTLENALSGAHQRTHVHPLLHAGWMPQARREERELTQQALTLLEIAGLARFRDAPASLLPMGAQKKLEVVRALMAQPRLLMLDEPAAGLNDTETLELARLLVAIRRVGVTMMLIEHNMGLVREVADCVVVLDAGAIIATGTPSEVSVNPRVIEAYMGQEV
jgi:branched-chain amino acid transport system ATP-binding protein